MTDSELIASQAREIATLRADLAEARERIARAKLLIFGIGGPLNDNVLGYSLAQLQTFRRILSELERS